MVDAVSQQIVQDIASKNVGQSPTPSSVSDSDAASFQTMMGQPPTATDSSQGVNPAQAVQGQENVANVQGINNQDAFPIDSLGKKTSLGDRILQGLDSSQNSMQDARNQITSRLQGDSEINKMYELQLQIGQLSTNQQVLGQVGSKTSQGIQTLLKGQ